jgi:acetylornithine deacetylase/succinyl-diaminopimelate desuccinylase-like protein
MHNYIWKSNYLLIGLLFCCSIQAGNTVGQFAEDAPDRLVEYLQINTVNPPGNEALGVAFFAKYLAAAGIEFQVGESAPGRGNIWAKLPGGDKQGIVLLNHIDVVLADEKYWSVDPYKGLVKDGYIYGRGALDMKGLGIAQFQAFLSLAASGEKLNRDVWFLATADEEAGGQYGAGWMVKHHPEIFEKVGFLLNEGGFGFRVGDDVSFIVEVTQKVPLWLRLTATGNPGHGSAPQVHTAVTRLFKAGHRITTTNFKPRVIKPVKRMFSDIAASQPMGFKEQYTNISKHILDTEFMLALQTRNPQHHSLLRDTCSVTRIEGSSKINVVPAEAKFELDCRLLPDQSIDVFVKELELLIADPNIKIERLMEFSPASSETETELFDHIQRVTKKHYPGSQVIPSVSTGFTDSHFFRDLGIVSYGFGPFMATRSDFQGVHGNDEKVSVVNMVNGTILLRDLLDSFAVK